MAAQIPLETISSSDDHDLLAQIPTNFTNDFQSFAGNSPTAISESGLSERFTQRLRGRKRRKNDEKEEILKKPKEVIHVRAKRGQATDSHSLAERVRREKINERLRCLQELVPGCYKKMGMAVMLDVIINYIRSLQNQIEFLSMELSAASMHGNNLERNTLEAVQETDADEFQEIERMIKEGYGGPTYLQSKWPL